MIRKLFVGFIVGALLSPLYAASPDIVSLTYKCTKGGCQGRDAFSCCPGDQTRMKTNLEKIKGVTKVNLNRETKEVTIEYKKGALKAKELTKAANKYGLIQ